MVSIPNQHFFQWVNQLRGAGYDVYWFDISGSGIKSERIKWLTQFNDWNLKWDFPGRNTIKNRFPKVYRIIQKFNDREVDVYFEKLLGQIKPDIVHSFAMQLSCLPILEVMKNHTETKWVYSSWGSDVFLHEKLGVSKNEFTEVLQRINYLITDCKRDYKIALENKFSNCFLGVYVGNGGLEINKNFILSAEYRNVFLIKGYEDGIGKALKIIEAIELLPIELFKNLEIIVYSADLKVKEKIESSKYFKKVNVKIYIRGEFISNDFLLEIMGKSILHIANSISDGMPAAVVEAMGMGAFPIQSNPGNVSEEVISNGKNGYLIQNPFDEQEIANHILNALKNAPLREMAMEYNIKFVYQNFNRSDLKTQIIKLYEKIGEASH